MKEVFGDSMENETFDVQFQPEFGFGLLTLGAVLVISSATFHSYSKRDSHIKIGTMIEATRKILLSSEGVSNTNYQVTLCVEDESFTTESYDKV